MDDRSESRGAHWPFVFGAAIGACLTAIAAGIIIWSPWSGDGGAAEAVQADTSTTAAPTQLLPGEAEAATLDYIYSRPQTVIAKWIDRGFEMTCSAGDQDGDRWIVECSAANTSFDLRKDGYHTRTIEQWGIFEVASDGAVNSLTVYCENWASDPLFCP